MDSDHQRGIYNKFHVTRVDGSSGEGGKHEHCEYFVFDLTHDQFARTALSAYSVACKGKYPQPSADLVELLGCISTDDKAIIDSLCAPETYGPELTTWPAQEDMPDGSEWDFSRNEWGKRVTERYIALGGRDAGWLESRTGHRIARGAFDPEFGDTLRRVYPAVEDTAIAPVAQPDPEMAAFLELAYQLGVIPNGRHVDSIMKEALARVADLHRRDGEAIRRREALERLAGTDETLVDSDLVWRVHDRIHAPVELPACVTAKEIDASHAAFLCDSSGDLTLGEWLLEHFNITRKE